MNGPLSHALCVWSALAVLPSMVLAAEGLPVTAAARQEPVRFQDEIVPVLAANCTACHNQKVREGGLSMDSLERMLAGGDSGPAIVAGKPAESPLFLRASHRQEDVMPPPGNSVGAKNLAPEQLGLLEKWIAEGAKGPLAPAKAIEWRPLPKGTGGVLAVAVKSDGRLAAAARAGRVNIVDALAGRAMATLVDPALASFAPDVAHADTVTALAFSPTDELLASGSFRTIKLWRRADVAKVADLPDTVGSSLLAGGAPGGPIALGLADGRLAMVDAAAVDAAARVRVFGSAGQPAIAGAMTADGSLLFVADKGNLVTAWRIADGTVVGRLARSAEVRSLAVIGGGGRLVTAEADGQLRVWPLPLPQEAADPAGTKPLKEISGASAPVVGLVEVPAMPGHVVGGCGDGVVRLWGIDAGNVVRQFAHGGPVAAVAVSADGGRLASVGGIPGVKLWNVSDGAAVAHASGDFRIADRLSRKDADIAVLKQDVEHGKAEVAASEKAKTTAAEEVKKAAEKLAAAEKAFKEKDEAAKAAKAAREEADRMMSAAMAAVPFAEAAGEAATKGAVAATAAAESAAAAVQAITKATEGNADAAESLKPFQAAAQSAMAAKAAADQTLGQSKTQIEKAKTKVTEATAKAAEKMKAQVAADEAVAKAQTGVEAAMRDGAFAAADVKRSEEALPLRQTAVAETEKRLQAAQTDRGAIDTERTASARPFVAVCFSGDGASLLGLDATGAVVTYGGHDGQPRRIFVVPAQSTGVVVQGERLVVGGGPSPAGIYDVAERWALVRTIGGERTPPAADEDPSGPPLDAVLALAFSPDGGLLASGSGRASRSGEIKLWRVSDGGLVRSLGSPHSDTVVALSFSRSGDRLASAGTDRFAKVHLVADGKTERAFEGHTGHVLGVAWQAHGRRLVTAGADNVVKVWDVASAEQQRTIQGPRREVTAVQFVGEGDEIVAASGDALVRVLNAASGAAVRQLDGAVDFVQSLAVAGTTAVAGGQDGRLQIWNVANPKPLHTLEPFPAP